MDETVGRTFHYKAVGKPGNQENAGYRYAGVIPPVGTVSK
jgi:hypothetical protein